MKKHRRKTKISKQYFQTLFCISHYFSDFFFVLFELLVCFSPFCYLNSFTSWKKTKQNQNKQGRRRKRKKKAHSEKKREGRTNTEKNIFSLKINYEQNQFFARQKKEIFFSVIFFLSLARGTKVNDLFFFVSFFFFFYFGFFFVTWWKEQQKKKKKILE